MVVTASATTFVVAAASALWRFSHLFDPPVPTCNVDYPDELPAVTCHWQRAAHCDVRCESSETYPLQEDGERTFLILTSSVRASFAARVLAGAHLWQGPPVAGQVVAPDRTLVEAHDDRAQRPSLAAVPHGSGGGA